MAIIFIGLQIKSDEHCLKAIIINPSKAFDIYYLSHDIFLKTLTFGILSNKSVKLLQMTSIAANRKIRSENITSLTKIFLKVFCRVSIGKPAQFRFFINDTFSVKCNDILYILHICDDNSLPPAHDVFMRPLSLSWKVSLRTLLCCANYRKLKVNAAK